MAKKKPDESKPVDDVKAGDEPKHGVTGEVTDEDRKRYLTTDAPAPQLLEAAHQAGEDMALAREVAATRALFGETEPAMMPPIDPETRCAFGVVDPFAEADAFAKSLGEEMADREEEELFGPAVECALLPGDLMRVTADINERLARRVGWELSSLIHVGGTSPYLAVMLRYER